MTSTRAERYEDAIIALMEEGMTEDEAMTRADEMEEDYQADLAEIAAEARADRMMDREVW